MKLLRYIIILCLSAFVSTAHATETEDHQFKGSHFLASYCECDKAALTDLKNLKKALLEAAKASGATILKSIDHEFHPGNGLTMVILLSESHASIHTYPEYGACFVDLFTCGDNCQSEPFDQKLRAYLHPKEVSARTLVRDKDITEKEV